ncbi:acyltransferase family-domain-containing protein [Apodospora peruviana]|uniref:Acyltransferase family-domain-containing protein n=1 Tax=Apodospora peruviana TaxID=516989 RepID=A0AAE0ID84_9PEZI|nr:acyltransferase family-domain-containing protein [Apodospora peruviana]
MTAKPQQQNRRNIKWVEGLRGITSALVIATHLARALDYHLFWPADEKDGTPRLLQLPFLRIPFQGRIGVPIFAFLTGFVCAYKPLKLAYQQGNTPASLMAIARSAFRRPPRLMFPAVIATICSFILSCFGAYTAANRCDSFWVRFDAPDTKPFAQNVRRLFRALLATWTSTENVYDRHQWAMRPLLVGAFQVYIVLAATIGMRFKYRILVHLLLMSYWWLNVGHLTETFGSNLALGTLLAELSQHRPTQNFISNHQRTLTFIVAPILLLVGGYIGSYPHENENYAKWSLDLMHWLVAEDKEGSRGSLLVPKGSHPGRRCTSFFIHCVAVSLFLSHSLQKLLSHRLLLWLGHHSFAVYLVHGSILRTVGMWIVYGISGQPWTPAGFNEDGTPKEQHNFLHPKSRGHKLVAIVVFTACTYTAAWAWMKWVDTACARATQWLEKRVFEDEEEERKESLAEKGFHHVQTANGNGHALLRPDESERKEPPP